MHLASLTSYPRLEPRIPRTELRRQEVYAVAVERLDTARRDLKVSRETRDVKAAELKVAMAEAWRTVLDSTVAAARETARDAIKDAFGLIATSLRVGAVEARHCETCD